jgi:hypothetical protein
LKISENEGIMKKQLVLLVTCLALVSFACILPFSSTASTQPPPTATVSQALAPTQSPAPTQIEPTAEPTSIPTDTKKSLTDPTNVAATELAMPTATSSGVAYFRDDFDEESGWTYEYITGNNKNQCEGPELRDSQLWWRCPSGEEVQVKVYKDDYTYTDVAVTAEFVNHSTNHNWTSLLCRVSDIGWYEFRFTSGGLYEIYRFDWNLRKAGENPYVFITNGTTLYMHTGLTTNKITMDCSGSQFQYYVNDQLLDVKIPDDVKSEFELISEGGVGVGFLSEMNNPGNVEVGFESFETSRP